MIHVRNTQKGFTIVELMVAMAGIAVLLLAIMTAVIQAAQTYNKGLTIKEVNLAGREMTDEFKRVIMASAEVDPVNDLVAVKNPISGETIGGRLCTGSVSYIWNYGKATQTNDQRLTKTDSGRIVRFGKIADQTRQYCALNGDGSAATESIPNEYYNPLLTEGDRSLDVFGFNLIADSRAEDLNTNQRLYTIAFILGSGDYRVMRNDYSGCREPGVDDPPYDLQYCVLQNYSFTVRSGNIGG